MPVPGSALDLPGTTGQGLGNVQTSSQPQIGYRYRGETPFQKEWDYRLAAWPAPIAAQVCSQKELKMAWPLSAKLHLAVHLTHT